MAAACLVVAGLSVGASAEEGRAASGGGLTGALDRTGPSTSAVDPVARGLIVQTTSTSPSDAAIDTVREALGDVAEVVGDDTIAGRISTIEFDEHVSGEVAAEVADEVEKRADVVWAAPDSRRTIASTPPVTADDRLYPAQRNLWDRTSPTGGYSIKAPSLWRKTQGSPDVVVAVVDTGIRPEHPDLAGKLVEGYDMIGPDDPDASVPAFTDARDGDGRDDDASDPGDWAEKKACYRGSPFAPSSWHGTFVAGQIAAATDNGSMIAAVAPGVKVQPIRVLAQCGGYDSDILAGMTWATGGTVPGIEDVNATPARIVNLSLGHTYARKSDRDQACKPFEAVAASGRSRGAIFVAAAGNDAANADFAVPASCTGFFSVGATSYRGFRASYSNQGRTVDLTAPGGDTFVEGPYDSIISLVNKGVRGPILDASGSGYARFEGTSMAAPQVAGAAALLRSISNPGPSALEKMLINSTSNFRAYSKSYAAKKYRYRGKTYAMQLNCRYGSCGHGYLDLSKVQAPLAAPTISGENIIGEPLTATNGTWVATLRKDAGNQFALDAEHTWFADDTMVGTGPIYHPTPADVGARISVVVRPGHTAFEGFANASEPTVTPVPPGPTVTLTTDVPSPIRLGQDVTVRARVVDGVEPVTDGQVQIRRSTGEVFGTAEVDDAGNASITIPSGTLLGGPNDIRAAYLGGEAVGPASSPPLTVVHFRFTSTVTVRTKSTIRRTARPSLAVTVRGAPGNNRGGLVRIYNGYRFVTQATMPRSGVRTILLPALTKGRRTIVVRFAGNSQLAPSTTTKYVRVK